MAQRKSTKAGVTQKKDYVGPYDGDDDRWMSRKTTDKGGNLKESLVPETSKPKEANDFHDGYSRSEYNKKKRNKNSISYDEKKKGDSPFFKVKTKGK